MLLGTSSNPQVNVSTNSSSFFSLPERMNQTSCLVYLEERDKCGFCLFQGTHINHALKGALSVGRWWCWWRGGGVICLLGAHSLHSLQELWKCPLHTFCSSAELRDYARGAKTPVCAAAGSEVGRAKLSRGVGLTSPQRVNLYPTVTPDPVTKVQRRHQTSSGWNSAFVGKEKRANWNLGNKRKCLFGIRIASTNEETIKPTPFSYFFSTEIRFGIGIKKTSFPW